MNTSLCRGLCVATVLASASACSRTVSHEDSTNPSPAPVAEEGSMSPPDAHSVREQAAHLAIPFQKNHGQWDDAVAFRASHFAGDLWVTADGRLVYSLLGPELSEDEGQAQVGAHGAVRGSTSQAGAVSVRTNTAPQSSVGAAPPARGAGWSLIESFVGGRPQSPRGMEETPTNVSYFLGDDETKWAPQVSTFAAVTLGDVWPGVEVRLRARGNNVEKFFYVRPHQDVAQIRLQLAGARSLRVAASGALVATTGNGDIELSAPLAYQDIAGQRRSVVVRYALSSDGYGFVVGDYDHAHELVIDPVLQSTYLGGSDYDTSMSFAINSSGEIVSVGWTWATGFPGVTGGAQSSFGGGSGDIVVSRLSANLTTLLQSTYLGGNDVDLGYAIAINASGQVVIGGESKSSNFPGRTGGAQATFGGGDRDFVVARLSANLTSLLQSTYVGGAGTEYLRGIGINSSGEVIVAGSTDGTAFPNRTGGGQAAYGGGQFDGVISRLNSNLTSILQSTYVGGSGQDQIRQMVIKSSGEIVVAGFTFSTTLPAITGGAQATKSGVSTSQDMFLSRVSANLTSILQSTYLGGASGDETGALALSSTGEILVAGFTFSTNFPGLTGGAQTVHGGGLTDVAVARLSANLTTLLQSTLIGGTGNEGADSIAVGATGDVFVGGYTSSTNYPGVGGGAQSTYVGNSEIVVSKLNANLTSLTQSTFLGGSGDDGVNDMRFSGTELIVAGNTTSTDFPYTAGGAQSAFGGGTRDAVFSRLTSDLTGPVPCTSDLTCSGATPFCKVATGVCVACLVDSNCSDGNVCTTDVCFANNTCGVSTVDLICCQTDLACDDGSSCTTDTCVGGATEFVTNGGMTGGNLTTPPASWTVVTGASAGAGAVSSSLGYSLPASQNVTSASPNGGNFAYVVQGASTSRGIQQTLTGLTVGQRYRVTGHYFMSPGTASPRSLTVQVRQGATTYTLGRRTY